MEPARWNGIQCAIKLTGTSQKRTIGKNGFTWLSSVVVMGNRFPAQVGRCGGTFDFKLVPHWRLCEYVAREGVLAVFGSALVTVNSQTATCSSKSIQSFRKMLRKTFWIELSLYRETKQTASGKSSKHFARFSSCWKQHDDELTLDGRNRLSCPFLNIYFFFLLSILF